MRRAIQTDRAPAAIGPYSQAIIDEETGLVFCSGQIGIDPATGKLVEGGVETEFRQVLENVRQLLAAAGCGLEGVVKTTLYLADMADFAKVNAIYGEHFQEPFPARSTIGAAGLPMGCRVELEILARRRGA